MSVMQPLRAGGVRSSSRQRSAARAEARAGGFRRSARGLAALPSADKSKQDDDRDRNAEKPEKNATSHGDLLKLAV